MSSGAIDVLVVGGGPAGMAAGISFGRAGLRTLVCERGWLPADKPCGEGVMPTGLGYLEHLGVSAYLDHDHTRPFSGIHYLSTAGVGASARFAEGPGQGIRRTELSRAFCERAQKIDALEVRPRTSVTLGLRGLNGTQAWLDGAESDGAIDRRRGRHPIRGPALGRTSGRVASKAAVRRPAAFPL